MLIVAVCLVASSVLGGLTPIRIAQLAKNYDHASLYRQDLLILGLIFAGVYVNRVLYQLFINNYVPFTDAKCAHYLLSGLVVYL